LVNICEEVWNNNEGDQDAEIVKGTIFLTLCLDPMYQFRPYAVIENLFVREEYRGQGIGKSLLEFVEKLCIDRNCKKIMLMSSSKRVEAHKFFESLGYSGSVSKGFKKYIRIST
jgi:GNAT superfamily N-acetyltransferase